MIWYLRKFKTSKINIKAILIQICLIKASFSQKKIKILKQVLINNKNIKFLIAPLIIKQILQVEAMKQKLIILQINMRIRNFKQIYKTDYNQQKSKTINF